MSLEDGRSLVKAAEEKPTKTTVSRVLDWMKSLAERGEHVIATSGAFP